MVESDDEAQGDIVLGIDLGTTNSVVAAADGEQARVLVDVDGQKLIPSVVSFAEDGQVLVGDMARERRLTDAANTVYATKRLIGRPFGSPEVRHAQERFAFNLVEGNNGGVRVEIRNQTYSLAEIGAYVLRECRRVAEQLLERECKKAVITVPANFNELQRSATKAAGKVAGLNVLRILNEPTAAAVAYGYGTEAREVVAVYDLGGGTFDITILELDGDVFEVVATAGDTFLGGDDIDLLVAEDMADDFRRRHGVDLRQDLQAFERLRAAGEWIKCELSARPLAKAGLPQLFVKDGQPLGLEYHTTRMKLEDRIRPLIERSLQTCQQALGLAGLDVAAVDRVVLVGGSTRIPLVRAMVSEFFAKEPRTDLDPDLVVALGAAIQGYSLAEDVPRRTLSFLKPPSLEEVEARQLQKEQARMSRPPQVAFAQTISGAPIMAVGQTAAGVGRSSQAGTGGPVLGPGIGDVRVSELSDGAEPRVSQLEDLTAEVEDVSSLPPVLQMPQAPAAAPPPTPSPKETYGDLQLPRPGAGRVGDDFSDIAPPPAQEGYADLDLPRPGGGAGPTARPPGRQVRDPMSYSDMNLQLPTPSGAPNAPGEVELPPPLEFAEPGALAAPQGGALAMAATMSPGDGPAAAAPLLMDVTPHSLGIETVGGWCEHVIRRNAPIPVEQTRIFTTARDNQDTVRVTVCQGEFRAFDQNQALGAIELAGLPPARRGQVQILVTFMLDANGTLDVKAVDASTGATQVIRVQLVGGFSPEDLQQMQQRQEASLQ